jgi:hypothetical protein
VLFCHLPLFLGSIDTHFVAFCIIKNTNPAHGIFCFGQNDFAASLLNPCDGFLNRRVTVQVDENAIT